MSEWPTDTDSLVMEVCFNAIKAPGNVFNTIVTFILPQFSSLEPLWTISTFYLKLEVQVCWNRMLGQIEGKLLALLPFKGMYLQTNYTEWSRLVAVIFVWLHFSDIRKKKREISHRKLKEYENVILFQAFMKQKGHTEALYRYTRFQDPHFKWLFEWLWNS